MDSLYKRFDSTLATCKLMGCDETSFPDLEKHDDDTKGYGHCMDARCLIKTSDPQRFSHIWNESEKGTIIGEYLFIYFWTESVYP